MTKIFKRTACALLGCYLAMPVAASDPIALDICLQTSDGGQHCIGSIQLLQDGDEYRYEIDFDDAPFSSHFLSMRPFKCLKGPDTQLWCHLPYTYEHHRRISANDLVNLEYDLLFIYKGPDEFGINPWQGRYFRLQWNGGEIVGDLREVDMNILAVPPATGNLRPIVDVDLHETDLSAHWLPRVTMRAQ